MFTDTYVTERMMPGLVGLWHDSKCIPDTSGEMGGDYWKMVAKFGTKYRFLQKED